MCGRKINKIHISEYLKIMSLFIKEITPYTLRILDSWIVA